MVSLYQLWTDIVSNEVDIKQQKMSGDVKAVQEPLAEQNDKLQQEKNIVIYNLPENRIDDKEGETKILMTLFNDVLKAQVNPIEVQKTIRLGRRTEANKIRPMLVS